MAESRTIQEIPVSTGDREHIALLMSLERTPMRDAGVARILAKYVGFPVELTPVPEGHTHDGKEHEGLEVHFRRIHQSVDAQDYGGDHCYRDPPGAAFVNVAEQLVVAA